MQCVSCLYFISFFLSNGSDATPPLRTNKRKHTYKRIANSTPSSLSGYEHPPHPCIQLMITTIIIIPPVSYDTRDINAKTPSHWRDEELLGDRAVFRAGREPAELIINPVRVINSFIIINDYKLYRI